MATLRQRVRLAGNGPRGVAVVGPSGLRGRVLQRCPGRARSEIVGAGRRYADRLGPHAATDPGTTRRDALPRRDDVFSALAGVRQLPPRCPRGRLELGPSQRRPGQPEEHAEPVRRLPRRAGHGLGRAAKRRGRRACGHHAHPLRGASRGRCPGPGRLPEVAQAAAQSRAWSTAISARRPSMASSFSPVPPWAVRSAIRPPITATSIRTPWAAWASTTSPTTSSTRRA